MQEWLILIVVSVLVIWLHNRVLIGISRKRHPIRMIWIMMLLSLSHLLHIMLFAVALYAGVHWLELGTITNCSCDRFYDFLYFSASNYTSLGYGEYAAAGGIRILSSLEGLIGLMMIGWSTAYAFWWMQRHWLQMEQQAT